MKEKEKKLTEKTSIVQNCKKFVRRAFDLLTNKNVSKKNKVHSNLISNLKPLTSATKGITLIALIITIIVMLILVGATITMALNGGLIGQAQKAKTQTEAEMANEQNIGDGPIEIDGEIYNTVDEYIDAKPPLIGGGEGAVWTQNKTSVTDGKIILEVGQAVTGYTGNNVGDGNWFVLGAETGKLLITTKENQGSSITLNGSSGFASGVNTLNSQGSLYSDEKMADSSRSIKIDDINRVTGYTPKSPSPSGMSVDEYGNSVKYGIASTEPYKGNVYYKGSRVPVNTTYSNYTVFKYLDGSTWKTLNPRGT